MTDWNHLKLKKKRTCTSKTQATHTNLGYPVLQICNFLNYLGNTGFVVGGSLCLVLELPLILCLATQLLVQLFLVFISGFKRSLVSVFQAVQLIPDMFYVLIREMSVFQMSVCLLKKKE